MATIKLRDLHPTGSDLFSGAESYMSEVTAVEVSQVQGGFGCSWNAHTGPYVRSPINYPTNQERVCRDDNKDICGYHDYNTLTCHS
ncbi:hypothetical protein C7B80_29915 [Cyanosarcina cf. burmensis CCALA 770]|nr:hypothetical protein C7B80_29915 [Cyanosarcina cf. burmensis CCALA 770]